MKRADVPGGSPAEAGPEITLMLRRLARGEREVEADLYSKVYEQLRQRARAVMRHQSAAHTLQSGDLVHEAWLKLSPTPGTDWQDRAHFLRVAVRAMRSVLVDHARARATDKRGGDRVRVSLEDDPASGSTSELEILALHEALERLRGTDEQLHRVAELHLFGGLNHEEIARLLEVSTRTVERVWRLARELLARDLEPR